MEQVERTEQEPKRTLVMILHAYCSSPGRLAAVAKAVRKVHPQALIEIPKLDAWLLSRQDPNELVQARLEQIDQLVAEAKAAGQPFTNIVLVGHSLGALLARKLYVVACGESREAPFEAPFHPAPDDADPSASGAKDTERPLLAARPWASRVSRIILLAGMNRGWRISHHLSLINMPFWYVGAGVCHLYHAFTGRWPLIYTIRRGSEFITQLRIQWILMRRRLRQVNDESTSRRRPGGATTIQLLGSIDDMVAPEDNIDIVSGGDFVYFDVPRSGHANVIEFDDPEAGEDREERFLKALTSDPDALRDESMLPADEDVAQRNHAIKKVVFVIHGIRDKGYWTHKIARCVQLLARKKKEVWASETSSYGYFPMLPFLFPWYRRKKVEWLMDEYAEALARYPDAQFFYVGHSNGTYLLAKALKLYPCCRFERVVFAGSVVARGFEWSKYMRGEFPQVGAVLNFVATRDWVVAFFPKLFELFPIQDLGSAGHDGFELSEKTPGVYEAGYVRGGHGAAIEEAMWDTIADFVVDGTANTHKFPGKKRTRNWLVRMLGWFPLIVWVAAGFALWLGWLGIRSVAGTLTPDAIAEAHVTGFAAAAYGLAIWLVLTRL